MKNLCIYHGNCLDGFGAATAVKMAYKNNIAFHFGIHNHEPPDVNGLDVIIVDFSYKRDVLVEMAEYANSIFILDHHQSAADDLTNLPNNVKTYFDMKKSGAVLAWEHYHPCTETPILLRYIQDSDLWKFELENTKEIIACLSSYPYDFTLWENFIANINTEKMREEGEAILRKQNQDIKYLIECASYRKTIAGYNVPVLNAPSMFSSEAGHVMAKNEPFAACYWDSEKVRKYSLRSEHDGIDVSKIAISI